jgi:hypothetical protein
MEFTKWLLNQLEIKTKHHQTPLTLKVCGHTTTSHTAEHSREQLVSLCSEIRPLKDFNSIIQFHHRSTI